MGLVLRTLRNLWFRDSDGAMSKSVDDEEVLVDSVDFSDQLETNQAVASAVFDDVSGLTLGSPTINGGTVEFTHLGTGSAVLQVVLNFVAYLAGLGTKYLSATHDLSIVTAGGVGGVSGAACEVNLLTNTGVPAPVTGLDGQYAMATFPSGSVVRAGPLVWDSVALNYDAVLLDDLDAADDGTPADEMLVCDTEAALGSYAADYAAASARPARTLRVPLRFIDPSAPESDYS